MKKIVLILLCVLTSSLAARSGVLLDARGQEMPLDERLQFIQATFDEAAAAAGWKNRFLAWLPGQRIEGSRAHRLQQLRKATWEMQEQLLKENNSQRFFVLLRRYEAELKAAAVLIGAGFAIEVPRRAFKQRKEAREKAKQEARLQELADRLKTRKFMQKWRTAVKDKSLKRGVLTRKH